MDYREWYDDEVYPPVRPVNWRMLAGVSVIGAIGIVALTLWATSARAQAICGPMTAISRNLAERFGEFPIAAAALSSGDPLYVYANEERTSFSVLIGRPDGMVCMVLSGENWTDIPFEAPEKGDNT